MIPDVAEGEIPIDTIRMR